MIERKPLRFGDCLVRDDAPEERGETPRFKVVPAVAVRL